MVLPLQGGIEVVGLIRALLGPKETDAENIADNLLHRLAVLLIYPQQEEGEHDHHHAHRRRAVANRNPQQKEQRNADERPTAEADQLPLGEIERHFGFYFCQVLGDWHISHFFTSKINKNFYEKFFLNSSIAKQNG